MLQYENYKTKWFLTIIFKRYAILLYKAGVPKLFKPLRFLAELRHYQLFQSIISVM